MNPKFCLAIAAALSVGFVPGPGLIRAYGQNQQLDSKERARAARDAGKQGQDAIPALQRYVTDTDLSVRLEAVKSLDDIGGPKTVDALLVASRDSDPEMQIRATDGLVNVYLPGYIKTGLSGSLQRAGNLVKAKFTDTDDQIVDAFVEVRPEVIMSLAHLATSGASPESRANACRALGILRGKDAVPELIEALHTKDNRVMYESLIALQKIRDVSAGPRVAFRLHDLDERIQIAAIETTGLLRNTEAAPDLRDVMNRTHSARVRRASVTALAMLADPADHAAFEKDLTDNDDAVRTAGAEGLARLKNPADMPTLDKAFNAEHKYQPRLAIAFAMVSLGKLDLAEFGPLRYLVNSLNQKTYQGIALAYLTELARELTIRQAIYPMLAAATKDEKIQLGIVFSRSGEMDSIPYLEAMQRDPDQEVAQESIRSLRTLRARLP